MLISSIWLHCQHQAQSNSFLIQRTKYQGGHMMLNLWNVNSNQFQQKQIQLKKKKKNYDGTSFLEWPKERICVKTVAVFKKWLFEIIYPVTCTISTILSIYNYHCVLTCSAYKSTEMFQRLHYLTHFRGGRFRLDSNCMNVKKKKEKEKNLFWPQAVLEVKVVVFYLLTFDFFSWTPYECSFPWGSKCPAVSNVVMFGQTPTETDWNVTSDHRFSRRMVLQVFLSQI